jgi:hypothetical protein
MAMLYVGEEENLSWRYYPYPCIVPANSHLVGRPERTLVFLLLLLLLLLIARDALVILAGVDEILDIFFRRALHDTVA